MSAGRVADLHTHTTYSDGTDAPIRVVEHAQKAGLSAMALTDHDNVDSLAVAQPAAAKAGIELIPGIEMSASYEDTEVHILGFLIDIAHPGLVRHLNEQKARRVRRIHEMVEKLQAAGVKIQPADVFQFAGEGTVGRPHVARALQKLGYVSTLGEAFQKYIGPKNPGFVPGSPLEPALIIRILREAGGVPVLAHPIYLKNDALIDQFVKVGLAGVEVYHSSHTPEEILRYERLTDRLKLLRTGGSDYHGNTKEGLPVGAVKVPYELIDELRRWKAAHLR